MVERLISGMKIFVAHSLGRTDERLMVSAGTKRVSEEEGYCSYSYVPALPWRAASAQEEAILYATDCSPIKRSETVGLFSLPIEVLESIQRAIRLKPTLDRGDLSLTVLARIHLGF